MVTAIVMMLYYNRRWAAREKRNRAMLRSQTSRLSELLNSSHLRLWTYQIDKRRYTSLTDSGKPYKEYNPIDFAQYFDRDDFEQLRSIIFDICDGKQDSATLRLRGAGAEGKAPQHYEVTLTISERDEQGQVKALLGVQRDITAMVTHESEVSQLLMRYHTVFNSGLSDMIYYDKDGRLSDINDKAKSTFKITEQSGKQLTALTIEDNPLFSAIDFSHPKSIKTTAVLNVDELKKEGYELNDAVQEGTYYYEASINPITNSDGEIEGIYISGRSVTEMVESVHRQQESLQRLRTVNKNIQDYIHNINYALRVSDVRLVNYYPDRFTFEISSNVNETQMHLSQLRCIRLASLRFRRTVSSVLNRMDHLTRRPIEQAIELDLHDRQGRLIWLMFNLLPVFDGKGRIERYFGMCRNITELVETERRLAVETRKAQETEELKQTFLTNMSYEIRTPLNTVVGFAELFQSDHDPADEPVFVEEIKKNSTQLLNLVNDILFLSRLDANMIESNKSETDFALFFDSLCQLGLQSANPEVKTIIENNYEHLTVNIDLDNVSKLIQRACAVAAAFTHQGTIRCKYEYWLGELTITIEDTGIGIDAERMTNIFSRFDHAKAGEFGTGLDLPIIQALARMMGGDIEAQSESEKGTTARMTIPCEATLVEKKYDEK